MVWVLSVVWHWRCFVSFSFSLFWPPSWWNHIFLKPAWLYVPFHIWGNSTCEDPAIGLLGGGVSNWGVQNLRVFSQVICRLIKVVMVRLTNDEVNVPIIPNCRFSSVDFLPCVSIPAVASPTHVLPCLLHFARTPIMLMKSLSLNFQMAMHPWDRWLRKRVVLGERRKWCIVRAKIHTVVQFKRLNKDTCSKVCSLMTWDDNSFFWIWCC